jgi:hypothetical protein
VSLSLVLTWKRSSLVLTWKRAAPPEGPSAAHVEAGAAPGEVSSSASGPGTQAPADDVIEDTASRHALFGGPAQSIVAPESQPPQPDIVAQPVGAVQPPQPDIVAEPVGTVQPGVAPVEVATVSEPPTSTVVRSQPPVIVAAPAPLAPLSTVSVVEPVSVGSQPPAISPAPPQSVVQTVAVQPATNPRPVPNVEPLRPDQWADAVRKLQKLLR